MIDAKGIRLLNNPLRNLIHVRLFGPGSIPPAGGVISWYSWFS